MSRSVQSNVIRGCLAMTLLAGLAVLVGNDIFPGVPGWQVALYAVGGGVAVLVVVVAATVVSLQFRQITLRNGGTDVQWFGFPSEPPGLVALREEARSDSAGTRPQPEPTGRPGEPSN